MMRRRKRHPRHILLIVFVLAVIGVTSCMKMQEYQAVSDQAMGAWLGRKERESSLPVREETTGKPGGTDGTDESGGLGGADQTGKMSGRGEWEPDPDLYPDELIEMYEKYPETLPFIRGYPEAKKSGKTKRDGVENGKIDIAGECHKGKIPLLIQWDQRWGYTPYGSSMIGISGCGLVCLSMVVVGLTGDTRWHPARVAAFSEKHRYVISGVGTDWRLFINGAEELGLRARRLLLQENELRRELMAGHPVICSMKPGNFTYTGHFIVLVGMNEKGGVSVNDPNSPKNSARTWPLKKVLGQIKAAWGYEAA